LLALADAELSMLGLDVLSRFDFLVVPGKRIVLRPRGDLRSLTRQRLERWAWLPSCPSPGCLTARFEDEPLGALTLEVEENLHRTLSVTLVCAAETTLQSDKLTLASLMTSDGFGVPFTRVVVRLQRLVRGRHRIHVPHAARFWFAPDGSGCRELRVLDIAPERPNKLRTGPQAALLP
jgi:hypothetical protein